MSLMSAACPQSAVIGQDGLPCFGHYARPPAELGLERFVYRTVLDKPASALSKYLHFKQFQFVSLCHPDWQIGIAIADIRYLASAFCYFYDRNTGQLDELELLKPFSLGVSMSPSPTQGEARISGKQHISLTLQHYNWHVRLSGALLQGEFSLNGAADASPLALCTPTGYNGWTYTQKHNALPLNGTLSYRGKPLDVTAALAGYDFSAGFMRRETSWRWGSISALLPQGRFGLNLACGVNETGTTENGLWLNGQWQSLPPVAITLNRQQPQTPWQYHDDSGRVKLQFSPQQVRQQKLDLGVLASNFRQYCGFFCGEITLANGEKLLLQQVPGLAEDHFARW
ncbi:hypothetical protein RNAN_3133 [Rheinheimera nanhaiensis E407-8]|uniref:DUF2804 domain-containing protein n=2 Tax=Rheinheimera TaxID=67575 RepID=I1E1E1_9GAMM|nr:hypothetical protein RNAN_3133 [Rheinheimera nanhaiensis E407-8]